MVKVKTSTKKDWTFQDVGNNVMKNAEQISENVRANADRIGAAIQLYLNRKLSK